jgi:hypothetical protein
MLFQNQQITDPMNIMALVISPLFPCQCNEDLTVLLTVIPNPVCSPEVLRLKENVNQLLKVIP